MTEKYTPTHRATPARTAGVRLRKTALLSGVAVAATGIAVSGGVLAGSAPIDSQASAALSTSAVSASHRLTQSQLDAREQQVSRSSDDRSLAVDRSKARLLSNASGKAVTRSVDLSSADPRSLARALMPQFGMSSADFTCVDNIWSQESGWNVHADNPSSSAYGIPQALPGSKMASAGPNWESNAETQIRWGLGYIQSRYGSACAAWSFKQANGWY